MQKGEEVIKIEILKEYDLEEEDELFQRDSQLNPLYYDNLDSSSHSRAD